MTRFASGILSTLLVLLSLTGHASGAGYAETRTCLEQVAEKCTQSVGLPHPPCDALVMGCFPQALDPQPFAGAPPCSSPDLPIRCASGRCSIDFASCGETLVVAVVPPPTEPGASPSPVPSATPPTRDSGARSARPSKSGFYRLGVAGGALKLDRELGGQVIERKGPSASATLALRLGPLTIDTGGVTGESVRTAHVSASLLGFLRLQEYLIRDLGRADGRDSRLLAGIGSGFGVPLWSMRLEPALGYARLTERLGSAPVDRTEEGGFAGAVLSFAIPTPWGPIEQRAQADYYLLRSGMTAPIYRGWVFSTRTYLGFWYLGPIDVGPELELRYDKLLTGRLDSAVISIAFKL